MATPPPKTKISMKLLIDQHHSRVLFAEATKDCVDFLLHILSLPLATIAKHLNKSSMAGSVGSLYGSLETLGSEYLQPGLKKDVLLNPKPAPGLLASYTPPLLTDKQERGVNAFYACASWHANGESQKYVTDVKGVKCPSCSKEMNSPMAYVAPAGGDKSQLAGGYVKGVVSYMIMDDLTIQPLSTISSVMLLNKFKVQDVSWLEEKNVELDKNLGAALLKAALRSKTVLTDVFVGAKRT